jgi:hypothetical protein
MSAIARGWGGGATSRDSKEYGLLYLIVFHVTVAVITQGVTKRCSLSYEPESWGGGGGCRVSANEYSCTYTGAQINFGDLTLHLTYVVD